MAKVKPIEKPTTQERDGRDQPQRRGDFPPLRGEAPSPEETEAFRNEMFEQHREVLSKLADS